MKWEKFPCFSVPFSCKQKFLRFFFNVSDKQHCVISVASTKVVLQACQLCQRFVLLFLVLKRTCCFICFWFFFSSSAANEEAKAAARDAMSECKQGAICRCPVKIMYAHKLTFGQLKTVMAQEQPAAWPHPRKYCGSASLSCDEPVCIPLPR